MNSIPIEKATNLENVTTLLLTYSASKSKFRPDPIKNSTTEFDSTFELTNQICHVINFSLSDWSTPGQSQSLCWNFVYRIGS